MRTLTAAFVTLLISTSTASAECYGDAANAFGCGVTRASESTLSHFGDSRNEVIPDYPVQRSIRVDDLFTPEEHFSMYKRIVLTRSRRSNMWVERTFRRSMQSGARPIRSFGNIPFRGARF